MNSRKLSDGDGITGGRTPLKLVHPRTTDTILNEDNKNLASEIETIKSDIASFKETVLAKIEFASGISNRGEVDKMEKMLEKINEIDKKVSVLEERTKNLDSLPTKDEITRIIAESKENTLDKISEMLKDKPSTDKTKLLIDEVITSKKIASEKDVELQVTKARNVQIIWTIGSIALATSAIGLMIKFL